MQTKHRTLKTLGAIAATWIALSAQPGVADDSQPIWAGHFKNAYGSGAVTDTSGVRSKVNSLADRLLWASHFKPAHDGSFGEVVRRPDAGKYLLWAGHFRQAYPPAQEADVTTAGITALALEGN
jgi:hypothetical protein